MLKHAHPYLPTYIVVSVNGGRFFSVNVSQTRQYISMNRGDISALYLVRNGRTIALPIWAI